MLPEIRSILINYLESSTSHIRGLGFCLSSVRDSLSQWRGYADDGGGVSIGFNEEYLKALCGKKEADRPLALLKQVEYDRDKQKAEVRGILGKTLPLLEQLALSTPTILGGELEEEENKKRDLATQALALQWINFIPLLFSLKNPAFKEEKEIRLLRHTFLVDGFPGRDELKFQALSDRISPFKTIGMEDLGVNPIEEILLGPRNITPPLVVQRLLRDTEFRTAKVRKSEASYR